MALSLVAGGVSIYFDPRDIWIMPFFGLLYPWVLIVNIFFVFFWIIGRLKYTLVSLIAILITIPVLKTCLALRFSSGQAAAPAHAVKVMSYNVRNFDLYNWSNEDQTMKLIMEFIRNEQPDVACFQEFFNADSGKFKTIKALMQKGGFTYYAFAKTVSREKYGAWGIATFSRYPIINHGEIRFENSKFNSSLFTDLQIDSTVVRVFNVHLQSVYFSRQDYEYIEKVTEDQDVHLTPTRRIASKLRQGFAARSSQSIRIRDEVKRSPYPVWVCGDFNDTPASFSYHTIACDLSDAFLSSGSGIGATYSGFIPAYRIDYILYDKKFTATQYKTICEKYSDHYPITCFISIK